jgi:hypothetical protein
MNDARDNLDDLLASFIDAPAAESDMALERIYRTGIEPIASSIIRKKLGITLRPDDERQLNQTGLEILGDIKCSLVEKLGRLRLGGEKKLDNFAAYVTTVSLNAYRLHIREKHPARTRLRNKVRYILTRSPKYALWKTTSDAWVGGLAEWHGPGKSPVRYAAVDELRQTLSKSVAIRSGTDENDQILVLIDAVFSSCSQPVELESLVSVIWNVLDLRETLNISESAAEYGHAPSTGHDPEQEAAAASWLKTVWDEVCAMPLRHRRALLLNLTDGTDENLIVFLPLLGIASIRQIAAVLEYEAEDFARLWPQLPLDDRSIARRMGLERQQVINLRQSARQSLRRRLLK